MSMKHAIGAILLCLILFGCSPSQPQFPEPAFISITTGLQPEHVQQTPFMEKESCPPESEDCEVTRIYADGSLYFYVTQDSAAPTWAYFTKVKPSGMAALEEIFTDICGIDATVTTSPTVGGTLAYRWHVKDCAREIVIKGVEYGPYEALGRVSDVINGNLEQFRPIQGIHQKP